MKRLIGIVAFILLVFFAVALFLGYRSYVRHAQGLPSYVDKQLASFLGSGHVSSAVALFDAHAVFKDDTGALHYGHVSIAQALESFASGNSAVSIQSAESYVHGTTALRTTVFEITSVGHPSKIWRVSSVLTQGVDHQWSYIIMVIS